MASYRAGLDQIVMYDVLACRYIDRLLHHKAQVGICSFISISACTHTICLVGRLTEWMATAQLRLLRILSLQFCSDRIQ